MFYLSWWADYPDPENFLFPLFHSSNHGPAGNRTRYTNATVDALIEYGRDTWTKKRETASIKELRNLSLPMRRGYFSGTELIYIRQPGIKNYKIYPIYSMDKGTEVSF